MAAELVRAQIGEEVLPAVLSKLVSEYVAFPKTTFEIEGPFAERPASCCGEEHIDEFGRHRCVGFTPLEEAWNDGTVIYYAKKQIYHEPVPELAIDIVLPPPEPSPEEKAAASRREERRECLKRLFYVIAFILVFFGLIAGIVVGACKLRTHLKGEGGC